MCRCALAYDEAKNAVEGLRDEPISTDVPSVESDRRVRAALNNAKADLVEAGCALAACTFGLGVEPAYKVTRNVFQHHVKDPHVEVESWNDALQLDRDTLTNEELLFGDE